MKLGYAGPLNFFIALKTSLLTPLRNENGTYLHDEEKKIEEATLSLLLDLLHMYFK